MLKSLETKLRAARTFMMRSFFETPAGIRALVQSLPPRIKYVVLEGEEFDLLLDPRDYVGKRIAVSGNWHAAETAAFLEFYTATFGTRPDRIMLEIGAHIGTQSLQFATCRLFSRVVSVEPMPENYAVLSRNIRLNGLDNVLSAVNCAVADKAGKAVMQADAANSGAHSLRAATDTPSGRSVEVEVLTVGGVLERADASAGDVGCVWIDAEGFEFEIVRSALEAGIGQAMFHVEFTPRFYGEAKTAEFITFLRERFGAVHFLTENGIEPATFDDLGKVTIQQDIVLTN